MQEQHFGGKAKNQRERVSSMLSKGEFQRREEGQARKIFLKKQGESMSE